MCSSVHVCSFVLFLFLCHGTLFQGFFGWFRSLEEAMLVHLRRCTLAVIASHFVIHCMFQNVTSNTIPFVEDSSIPDTVPKNILPEKDKDTTTWTIEQESTKQEEKTAIVEIAKYFDNDLFLKFERAESKQIHSLVFAVKQNNIDVLEEFLLVVSDPLHPHYAQYKTKTEVEEMTANPHGRQMVVDYLTSIHGVNIVSETANGEYITASATIGMYSIPTTHHLLSLGRYH